MKPILAGVIPSTIRPDMVALTKSSDNKINKGDAVIVSCSARILLLLKLSLKNLYNSPREIVGKANCIMVFKTLTSFIEFCIKSEILPLKKKGTV